MRISGTTTVTGIFGFPVRHTLSPAMQNAAFAASKIDAVYLPFEIAPAQLRAAVGALRTLGLLGVNVTIPHKEKVSRYLDALDPLAEKIGSVNTIVNTKGRLTGYNTDAEGFLKDLRGQGFSPKGKTALIIGAGGAGRAVAMALVSAGCARILLANRSEGRARRLSRDIPGSVVLPFEQWKTALPGADLLVNTTSLGMRPGDPELVNAVELRPAKKNLFIYDIVYNRRTPLVTAARKAGLRSCGGLGMLLWQGAIAFELWTGRKAPAEVMERALTQAIRTREKGV